MNGFAQRLPELLTAAQMRAVEEAAIGAGAVTGAALMERAGAGVVAAILAAGSDLAGSVLAGTDWAGSMGRARVLCGPGNNGGDGYVIARLLHDLGWQVAVHGWGDADRLPPDARRNHDHWRDRGPVLPLEAALDAPQEAPEVIIDALFGTGVARDLPGPCRAVLAGLRARPGVRPGVRPSAVIVAVDLPSGLCADSGRDFGAVAADLTVSFHRAKRGHYLDRGLDLSGRMVVADIGLGADRVPGAMTLVDRIAPEALAKAPTAHKFGHGHALVLAGGPGQGGAARLAARGALRVGAGLVTLGCAPAALAENAARVEALMLRPLANARDLARALDDARLTALCLGPGLGLGARQAQLLAVALRARRAMVIDADAITLLARDPALQALLHPACVLTPHAGEFARLFPDLWPTGQPLAKPEATRQAAARCGAVVLFKGQDTVIAAPDGQIALHAAAGDLAAPWLATAGSGDVLAGILTGLLARGLAPFEAACTAAWLHAACARGFGPGLIAEDLPDQLPAVFRSLGL